MTIEVRIENRDASRTVEVLEDMRNQDTGAVTRSFVYHVAPGGSITTHIHLLRDLVIRELKP